MNVTKTTLQWFLYQSLPQWAVNVGEIKTIPTIDEVLKTQWGYSRPSSKELACMNLLSLLKMVRRRQRLLPYLRMIQENPSSSSDGENRARLAKKWADRIEKSLS